MEIAPRSFFLVRLPAAANLTTEPVGVAFEDPDGDAETLEVTVVSSTLTWKQRQFVDRHPEIKGLKSGSFNWRMYVDNSNQTVLDFVLLDARGNRSEPLRKALNFQ